MFRGVLGGEQHRPAPLAAQAEPLEEAQQEQQRGAATPSVAYVGTQPTATVAQPVRSSEAKRTGRRPYRSPTWPKRTEPSGRATNPAAKVPNAARVPASGEKDGKKSGPRTRAAAVP